MSLYIRQLSRRCDKGRSMHKVSLDVFADILSECDAVIVRDLDTHEIYTSHEFGYDEDEYVIDWDVCDVTIYEYVEYNPDSNSFFAVEDLPYFELIPVRRLSYKELVLEYFEYRE